MRKSSLLGLFFGNDDLASIQPTALFHKLDNDEDRSPQE